MSCHSARKRAGVRLLRKVSRKERRVIIADGFAEPAQAPRKRAGATPSER